MINCPFTMSDAVAEWLESAFHANENEPSLSGKSPILFHALGRAWLDSTERPVEWWSGVNFIVGWDFPVALEGRPGQVAELFGARVFIPEDTLAELHGKRLVFETIESTRPDVVHKRAMVIRA